MLPTILHDSQISAFNFYHQGAVRQGMTTNGQLYKFVATFPRKERAQAFERACQMSCHHATVLTTGISGYYDLWVDVCAQGVETPAVMPLNGLVAA